MQNFTFLILFKKLLLNCGGCVSLLPQNSYVEVLGPSTSKFGLIWGYWSYHIQHDWCLCKKGTFGGRPAYRENTMWTWECPSTNQGEGLKTDSSLTAPRRNKLCQHFQILGSKTETIHYCCLSHTVCDNLLWQPQQTNIELRLFYLYQK